MHSRRNAGFRAGLASLCLMILATLPTAAEDLTILAKTTSEGSTSTPVTIYVSGNRLRSSTENADVIVDHGTGRLVFIDHKRKVYSETSLAEMKAALDLLKEKMRRVSEDLKRNPKAAELMGRMMGDPGEATLRKGTGARKIAGYDCDAYVVNLGDAIKADIWVTTALEPPAALLEARQVMALSMGGRLSKLFDEMSKIHGYPLAETVAIKMAGKTTTMTTEATEVKKGSVPVGAFDLPTGYKKEESPFKKLGETSPAVKH